MSCVPAVRTLVTLPTLAAAFERALGDKASAASVQLLVAHSALETGYWRECWNWNLGNVKHGDGDGYDYCERDCGEEIPDADVPDDPRVTVVRRYYRNGKLYASVRVKAGHPWARFRALADIDTAAADHVRLLRSRYAPAWSALERGDALAYARSLALCRYYTANPEQYGQSLLAVLREVQAKMADTTSYGASARDALEALFTPRPGEHPGEYASRCVQGLDGAHPDADGILFHLARKVEGKDAGSEEYRATNCATTMRWIWAWLGCPHPWVSMPDRQVRALDPAGPVSWCLKIARDMGACVDMRGRDVYDVAGEGWGLHYATPGANDDHMEWIVDADLKDPAPDAHCGGGRGGNRITCDHGDVHRSLGRPVAHAIDPARMGFRPAPPLPLPPPAPTPVVEPDPPPPPPATPPAPVVVAGGVAVAAASAARLSGADWAIGVAILVAAVAVAAALIWGRRG